MSQLQKKLDYVVRQMTVITVICVLAAAAVPGMAGTLVDAAKDKLAAAERRTSSDSFSFVLFSDTHVGQNLRSYRTSEPNAAAWPDPQLQPMMPRVLSEIDLLKPVLAIGVGDLIDGGNDIDKTLYNKEWDVYTAVTSPSLTPIFPAPGNHDIEAATGRAIWKERVGPTYYSFDYRTSHFIVLDSLEDYGKPRLSDEQMSWLRSDLEANRKSKNIFLVLHIPLFVEESYPDAEWGKIHDLLKKYPVRGVYAGHWHSYRLHAIRDGIQYVVLSSASGDENNNPDLGEYHTYLLVTVNGNTAGHIVIRPGSIEPPDVVTAESRQQYQELPKQITAVKPAIMRAGQPLDDTVELTIENPRASASEVTLKWQANGSGISVVPEESKFTLPPSGKVNVSLKITGAAASGPNASDPQLKVTLPYPTGNRIAEFSMALSSFLGKSQAPRAKTPPAIDGKLSEWSAVPAYPIVTFGVEPSDLSTAVRFMWDDTYLYIAAEVQDNIHHAVTPDEQGGGDALWIMGLIPTSRVALFNDGRVLVQDLAAKPYKDLTSTVSASVTYEAGTTRYEVAWPWSQMPAKAREAGKPLAVDIYASDRDDTLTTANCPKICRGQTFQLDLTGK